MLRVPSKIQNNLGDDTWRVCYELFWILKYARFYSRIKLSLDTKLKPLSSGLLKVNTFLAGTDGYFSVSNCLQPFQKFFTADFFTKFSSSLFSFFLCMCSFGKIVDYDLFSQDSWTEEKFSSENLFDFQ